MGPVRLGVGTEWLLDGRAWRVVRQLAPDRFVAQDVGRATVDDTSHSGTRNCRTGTTGNGFCPLAVEDCLPCIRRCRQTPSCSTPFSSTAYRHVPSTRRVALDDS